MAVGGLRARVMSGVRERREVHSMTPDRSAEICFDLLLLVEVRGVGTRIVLVIGILLCRRRVLVSCALQMSVAKVLRIVTLKEHTT
jgi:hypothetical protein